MERYERLVQQLDRLVDLARALSVIQDEPRLLEKILEGAIELTRADGGTLYQVTPQRGLHFSILRNSSLGLRCGGTAAPCDYPDIPLSLPTGQPNLANVCAFAFHMRHTVNLADAYESEGFDFSGMRAMDQILKYRSKSFLTVPLMDHRKGCIAVLQLINRLDDKGQPSPFSLEDVHLAEALASQAAIFLTNTQLLADYQGMFEATINVLADAVDQRSPHTGRHSRRVPVLAVEIAHAVNRQSADRGERLTDEQIEALRLAALLHDVGKISIPDRLLDKKTRLWATLDGVDLIALRYQIMALQAGLLGAGQTVGAQGLGLHGPVDPAEELEFLRRCDDQGTTVTPEDAQRIRRLAASRNYLDNGHPMPVITPEETEGLCTEHGTLTEADRRELSQHPMRSYELLRRIPFTGALSDIPVIARNHHEWCNGHGYPNHLNTREMDLSSRILPLADIFEALTAPDRPYRKPAKVSDAEKVLQQMADEGHLDPGLVKCFIDQRVGYIYAKDHLEPWQAA